MKRLENILQFELKNYAENKAFVRCNPSFDGWLSYCLFFHSDYSLVRIRDTSNTTADLSVMLVKADDPTQADMVKKHLPHPLLTMMCRLQMRKSA